jgi:hypothetical protein
MLRQGDVFITRVDAIPEHARRSPLPHGILVHGEMTAHSHRIDNPASAILFSGGHGGREFFLEVRAGGARIVHEEHGALALEPGFYRAWRQREYSPEEIRVVYD